jgi:predicted 3-demethylubiquinone-9 3-methyltransferase (glyoxalase superfamily)
MQKITNQLLFNGEAEEAMNFYISLFPDSKIEHIQRYGPNEAGPEGTVVHAVFTLAGQTFTCIDSSVKHNFTFTPAMTLSISCATPQETDDLFEQLSAGGQVFMPLSAYPFSEKFAWVADKYGVSWQVNLKR